MNSPTTECHREEVEISHSARDFPLLGGVAFFLASVPRRRLKRWLRKPAKREPRNPNRKPVNLGSEPPTRFRRLTLIKHGPYRRRLGCFKVHFWTLVCGSVPQSIIKAQEQPRISRQLLKMVTMRAELSEINKNPSYEEMLRKPQSKTTTYPLI